MVSPYYDPLDLLRFDEPYLLGGLVRVSPLQLAFIRVELDQSFMGLSEPPVLNKDRALFLKELVARALSKDGLACACCIVVYPFEKLLLQFDLRLVLLLRDSIVDVAQQHRISEVLEYAHVCFYKDLLRDFERFRDLV